MAVLTGGVRYLHYAGGHVLLADRTCKAMLRYARALADAGRTDVVTVPVITAGGSKAYAHFLLGPGSQFLSLPVENGAEEPFDAETIALLEDATARLQPGRPEWPAEMTDIADLDESAFPQF